MPSWWIAYEDTLFPEIMSATLPDHVKPDLSLRAIRSIAVVGERWRIDEVNICEMSRGL